MMYADGWAKDVIVDEGWRHCATSTVGVGPWIAFGSQRMIKFCVRLILCASSLSSFLGCAVYLRCAVVVLPLLVVRMWGQMELETERMGTSNL